MQEIKIGFRFIFQSNTTTITDTEVSKVVDAVVNKAVVIDSVTIPGLN
jgi:phenylalanyl-tRNA synthetase beta subunit